MSARLPMPSDSEEAKSSSPIDYNIIILEAVRNIVKLAPQISISLVRYPQAATVYFSTVEDLWILTKRYARVPEQIRIGKNIRAVYLLTKLNSSREFAEAIFENSKAIFDSILNILYRTGKLERNFADLVG